MTDAAAINQHAIQLRARGAQAEAIAAFRAGIERFPKEIALHQNLAQALYETGDTLGAVAAHREALAIDSESVPSHLALYELLQITGERDAALQHQRKALEHQRVFSSIAPDEKRSLLLLLAPGDWQANIPVDFLFDRSTTSVHKLYLLDVEHLQGERIPPHDVAWNAIAESVEAIPYLALAELVLGGRRKPRLNEPGRVIMTSRVFLPHALQSTGAVVAPVAELQRNTIANGNLPFDFPIIVRPVGSHAGHGLEKIDKVSDLSSYVHRVSAERYFVSPFIDYRSADGFFRKYRIVFVDGMPYPVHLAISPNWMIHYYNAPMSENRWMRDEEARFLADLNAVFDGPRHDTLVAIAREVGLEYFGIDCAVTQDGKVLVFEADPAMLVHTSDPIELYPYKHEYVPRIYRAVERMIDDRLPADT